MTKKLSDGIRGRGKHSDKMARAIPKEYLSLAYGVDKMLQEWVILFHELL